MPLSDGTGRLVTLEGGEGAGKSTLVAGLRDYFQRSGLDVLCTREPGGTSVGEAIRGLVLDRGQGGISVETELLLMFAARAQLVQEVIRPALAAGRWVLCDRFTDASYAYQGGGRGLDRAPIAQLEHLATADLVPDLTLLLDIPVGRGRARTSQRGVADRIEAEHDDFFERVRTTYLARAQAEPQRIRVIDAAQAPEAVLDAAIRMLDRWRVGIST